MKILLPILFAGIAALGNAMFALGQKQSVGVRNGLLFVALSALTAFIFALVTAPFLGGFDAGTIIDDD